MDEAQKQSTVWLSKYVCIMFASQAELYPSQLAETTNDVTHLLDVVPSELGGRSSNPVGNTGPI